MTRSFRNLFRKTETPTQTQTKIFSPFNTKGSEKPIVSCTNSPLRQGGQGLDKEDTINTNNNTVIHPEQPSQNNVFELNSQNIFLKDLTQQIDYSHALPTRLETEMDELDSPSLPRTSAEGKRILSQNNIKERNQGGFNSHVTSLVMDSPILEKSGSQPVKSIIANDGARVLDTGLNNERIDKRFMSIISLSRLDHHHNANTGNWHSINNDKTVSMDIKDEKSLKETLNAKFNARNYQPRIYSKPSDL